MDAPSQTFSFKPALLAKAREFRVYEDRVEYQTRDGEIEAMRFADIKSSRFAVTTAREYRFRRLDLVGKDGRKFQIAITASLVSNAKNDEDVAMFFALVDAIAERLAALRPELEITYSETAKVIWIMFLIGAAALLAAGGIMGLAIATNVSDKKLMNAAFPMALLAGLGLFTCVNSNPFKPQPTLTWQAFRKIIQSVMK